MMLHPATVHFAIVLPVVASIFGIIYLVNKNETIGKLSSGFTFFSAIAMLVAWYTGYKAGPEVYNYLSEAGQHELVEHKTLGLYLTIAFVIIAAIKSTGCRMKNFTIEAIAIILLLIATATTFMQAKDGGEIVYEHGMPFKSYMIEESLNEAAEVAAETGAYKEGLEAYQEAHEDIKLLSEEVNAFYTCDKEENEEEHE